MNPLRKESSMKIMLKLVWLTLGFYAFGFLTLAGMAALTQLYISTQL